MTHQIQILDLGLFQTQTTLNDEKELGKKELYFALFYYDGEEELDPKKRRKINSRIIYFPLDFVYEAFKADVVSLNQKHVENANLSEPKANEDVNYKSLFEDIKKHVEFSKKLIVQKEGESKSPYEIADIVLNPLSNLGLSIMEELDKKGDIKNLDLTKEPVYSNALKKHIRNCAQGSSDKFITSFPIHDGSDSSKRLKELLKQTFSPVKLEKGYKISHKRVVVQKAHKQSESKEETNSNAPAPLTLPTIIANGKIMGISDNKRIDHEDGTHEVQLTFVVPRNTKHMLENRNFTNVWYIQVNNTGIGDQATNPVLKIKVKYNFETRKVESFDKFEKLFTLDKDGEYVEYQGINGDGKLSDDQKKLLDAMEIVVDVHKISRKKKLSNKVVKKQELTPGEIEKKDHASMLESTIEDSEEHKKQRIMFLGLEVAENIEKIACLFSLEKDKYSEIIYKILDAFHAAESTTKAERGKNYWSCINALSLIFENKDSQQVFINIMTDNTKEVGTRFLRNPYIKAMFNKNDNIEIYVEGNYKLLHELLVEQIMNAYTEGSHPAMPDGIDWQSDYCSDDEEKSPNDVSRYNIQVSDSDVSTTEELLGIVREEMQNENKTKIENTGRETLDYSKSQCLLTPVKQSLSSSSFNTPSPTMVRRKDTPVSQNFRAVVVHTNTPG